MAAVLRILPVGLVITLMTRYRPDRSQWGKLLVVSLLCMSPLHWPLFVAAYRLPGGLAALLVASQPLLIMIMGWLLFGTRTPLHVAIGVFIGLGGVAMILIAPNRLAWDTVGIAAALLAACSMALGILLVKRWQLAIPTLAFTGWQLLLGGHPAAVRAGLRTALPAAGDQPPGRLFLPGGDRHAVALLPVVPGAASPGAGTDYGLPVLQSHFRHVARLPGA